MALYQPTPTVPHKVKDTTVTLRVSFFIFNRPETSQDIFKSLTRNLVMVIRQCKFHKITLG